MGVQSIRQTLIWSLVATTIWSSIVHFTSGGTIGVTLATFPLLFVIMFFTMRVTNRFTGALTRRWISKRPDAERAAAPDAASEPVEATSMRPEHAQRRRTRRKRRRGRH